MTLGSRSRLSALTRKSWPDIPWAPWRMTAEALHLYLQIVGKYRLSHAPWLNHSWHATFYVSPRGLTTGAVHDGDLTLELLFDLVDHSLVGTSSEGRRRQVPLRPMSVSRFYEHVRELVTGLGGRFSISLVPNEIPDGTAFPSDAAERPYDREAVGRFFRALLSAHQVFERFRTGFLGKTTPAHLFWGSFDLAVTRFSGRTAPAHPGGIPALPDEVVREAYSHEVASAGFWPGAGLDEPAFYAYAYPEPPGFAQARVEPVEAFYHADMREFILPYEVVRRAHAPETMLLSFLHSTYEAASSRGSWDRIALECPLGEPLAPRRSGVPQP